MSFKAIDHLRKKTTSEFYSHLIMICFLNDNLYIILFKVQLLFNYFQGRFVPNTNAIFE